ncbi:hypothetical protein HN011_001199 [Eciton burchellii]|nr:hypothetical protein HN011_001199 [Eciton burchellii]
MSRSLLRSCHRDLVRETRSVFANREMIRPEEIGSWLLNRNEERTGSCSSCQRMIAACAIVCDVRLIEWYSKTSPKIRPVNVISRVSTSNVHDFARLRRNCLPQCSGQHWNWASGIIETCKSFPISWVTSPIGNQASVI